MNSRWSDAPIFALALRETLACGQLIDDKIRCGDNAMQDTQRLSRCVAVQAANALDFLYQRMV